MDLLSRRRNIINQDNIPYSRVLYLGFNGTQYVNSLIYPLNYPNAVNFKVEYKSYCPASWGWLSQNKANNIWLTSFYKQTYYGTYSNRYIMGTSLRGSWHTYIYDSTAGFYIDGSRVAQFTATIPATTGASINSIPLYIGALWDTTAQRVDTSNSTGMFQLIEYYKIWISGNLVRDFIPVLSGGVGFFYDKVSGQLFGNSGTGTFLLPESLNGFTQIEYLQSTNQGGGEQYIATQYIPTPNTKIVLDAALNDTSILGAFMGLYDSSGTQQRFHIGIYQQQWHFGVGTKSAGNTWTNFSLGIDTARHVFTLQGNGYCSVDSTSKQINPNNSSSYNLPFHIYSQNISSGAKSYGRIKVWSVKVYEGNILTMDLIPCRDSNNVGYLYDSISKRLLGNAGTGSFVLGPDV